MVARGKAIIDPSGGGAATSSSAPAPGNELEQAFARRRQLQSAGEKVVKANKVVGAFSGVSNKKRDESWRRDLQA